MPFTLSLELSHPRMRAAEITASLGFDPDRCWDKGAARNTADGRALAGRNKETYWRADFAVNEMHIGLADVISERIDLWNDKMAVFQNIAATGGTLILAVFWSLQDPVDTRLPVGLLQRMVEFGMGLDLQPLSQEAS